MDFNKYNSGELRTELGVGESRYTESGLTRGERNSAIAVICAILVLAIVSCGVFALFTDEALPVWRPSGSSSTTTTTTSGKNPGGNVPETQYPYATVTDKDSFIATAGGVDLGTVDLYSEYAILIKLSDMSTVAHQGADESIYPASMTKVMTIVTALDMIEDLDDGYVLTSDVLARIPDESSTAYLASFVGKTVSVRDLLYGISYMSGSDSVICLIDYLNLTEAQFVARMNEKAAQIGLESTVFGGAIGMDDEENKTTCRDVAAMMAYAMENPLCRELFGGTEYKMDYIYPTYYNSTLHKNLTNNFQSTPETIMSGYTLLGAKSGYEIKAGYCLVSLIRSNSTGEEFILVTAKAPAYSAPYNKAPIFDMIELFSKLEP